ncbi:histidine kinase [Rhodobacterales bacterium HKCCE4037]|nr:histidine kinase [Rhodobacterales bacterium HKCCE4037]
MTSGRLLVIVIVLVTAVFGIALWWFVNYAYYEETDELALVVQRGDGTGIELPLAAEGNAVRAIDASSSPLRFRACFTLPTEQAADLLDQAFAYDDPVPLGAPGWFDCFDAVAIGTAIERDEAHAFLIQRDIARGVDRVGALFPDGRGYAWHQLNGTLE